MDRYFRFAFWLRLAPHKKKQKQKYPNPFTILPMQFLFKKNILKGKKVVKNFEW